MRKSVICLLVIVVGSWVSSVGQQVPQWKVIKEYHVVGGTKAIGLSLFTPEANGFYRASVYMAVYSSADQNAGFATQIDWTDRTGAEASINDFPILSGGSTWQAVGPTLFSPKVGSLVLARLELSDPPPVDATYDVVFTIEKLTDETDAK